MDLTPVKVEHGSATKTASSGERRVKFWRAPMDPNFISDQPGKSPMGMDLIPVYEDEAAEEGDMAITISPVVVQNMGVRTAPVQKKAVVKTVRTVGSIDYDEQRVRDVTTKFDGWIEELYADYTGKQIEKGKPLFSVYSPEIYSSQEEYLLALRNKDLVHSEALPEAARDMRGLAESARLRLELFDISKDQIEELARRDKPAKTMTILSPHTGIIVEKMARDGMRISPGMKLYTIADLSRVWVYVEIYENEVSFVKLGQDAAMELSYLPGETFRGKVIYVYPFVDTDTRTVKVRLEFDNPHLQLKPGMFADVHIDADLGRDSLQVPRSAVIDTGRRQIAFVALGEGRFEPRPVLTGVNLNDDYIEILDGLNEGELVVTSGQFLLDSESKLREAVLKMLEQKRGGAVAAATGASNTEDTLATGHDDHAHVVPIDMPSIGSASDLADLAKPVIERYLELQQVLSKDDHAGAQAAVRELEKPLAQFAAGAQGEGQGHQAAREHAISASETVGRMRERSLDAVRAQFSDLSKQITALLGLVGPTNIDTQLYAFYCPMAGSGWVQREEQARNPYYGFSMHQCGDSVSLLKEQ
jgi:Cu(I)/Ag(I) efflux system membrane fusion protein/cobalt-zinc-cadmium efflux system membrane fusion protein